MPRSEGEHDPDAPIPCRIVEEGTNGVLPIVRRVMTPEEIIERNDLNVANTAERLHRWALEHGLR